MNGTPSVQRSYDYLGPVREPPRNIQTSEAAEASGEMVSQRLKWPVPKPVR